MMKTQFRKKVLLTMLISSLLGLTITKAKNFEFEFDDHAMRNLGVENVDLSAFSGSNE